MSTPKPTLKTAESQVQPPASAAQKPSKTMSYEEYLAWADEDIRAEWLNGEVIIHRPPKNRHQTLVEFLDRLLGLFIIAPGFGGRLLANTAPPGEDRPLASLYQTLKMIYNTAFEVRRSEP